MSQSRARRMQMFTHLFPSDDDDERGAGRGEGPREQGSEERLSDRWMILEHRVTSGRSRYTIDARICVLRRTVGLRTREPNGKREISIYVAAFSPPHCLSQPPTSGHHYHRVEHYHLRDYIPYYSAQRLLRFTVRHLVATPEYPQARPYTHTHTRHVFYTIRVPQETSMRARTRARHLRFLPRAPINRVGHLRDVTRTPHSRLTSDMSANERIARNSIRYRVYTYILSRLVSAPRLEVLGTCRLSTMSRCFPRSIGHSFDGESAGTRAYFEKTERFFTRATSPATFVRTERKAPPSTHNNI